MQKGIEMAKIKHTIVLPRDGEDRIAIIRCYSVIKNEVEVVKALTRAISKWIVGHEDGKKAWEQSRQAFNVEDLANYCHVENLKYHCINEKIEDLEVELIGDGVFYFPGYTYDSVLVDDDILESSNEDKG